MIFPLIAITSCALLKLLAPGVYPYSFDEDHNLLLSRRYLELLTERTPSYPSNHVDNLSTREFLELLDDHLMALAPRAKWQFRTYRIQTAWGDYRPEDIEIATKWDRNQRRVDHTIADLAEALAIKVDEKEVTPDTLQFVEPLGSGLSKPLERTHKLRANEIYYYNVKGEGNSSLKEAAPPKIHRQEQHRIEKALKEAMEENILEKDDPAAKTASVS